MKVFIYEYGTTKKIIYLITHLPMTSSSSSCCLLQAKTEKNLQKQTVFNNGNNIVNIMLKVCSSGFQQHDELACSNYYCLLF